MAKSDELCQLVENVLLRMDVTAAVSVVERGVTFAVSVESEDSPLLIGRKGEVLDALQTIVRMLAYRLDLGPEARIMVDVNAYRRQQEENLMSFVNETAQRVKTSGTAETLRPMTSYERHLVHEVVSDVEGIESVSVGEGAQRRVTIRPKEE